MWQLVKPCGKRSVARRSLSAIRATRRQRPDCASLEDRRLLSVTLTDIPPAVPYVGSPVVWNATASGFGKRPVYQFSVASPGGGGVFQMVKDFSPIGNFTWNPMQQGTYEIQVVVKKGYRLKKSETMVATYTAQSRVTGDTAVVSPMANPLVALFSAPPTAGTSMYVQFAQQGPSPSWKNSSPQPIVPGESTNFIVAGMLPDATYLMRYVTNNGTVSAPLSFTTGSLPATTTFPPISVVQPPAPGTNLSGQSVIFHMGLRIGAAANDVNTFATNLNGNVIWYYDSRAHHFYGYAQNIEPGGTVMMLGGQPSHIAGGFNTVRQVNLAGDTLRQTNVAAVNAELAALHKPQILDFDHEAKLLPNGDTVVIASTPKVVNYHGTPTRFVGALVIVLNQNFQVSWVWNSFRWLNTNRLGTDHPIAANWLHANAVSWSPEDSNLVVSLRSQDWAVKVDYANGTGNGHVIWKLGKGGNFKAIAPPGTGWPWFSHQHDLRMINDNTVLVFDDGNTRHEFFPSANSRGQEWILNEQNRTATLVVNADLGNYSSFLGSSELLNNGDLAFTNGGLGPGSAPIGQSIVVQPGGTTVYIQQIGEYEYRSYFLYDLYSAGLLNV